MAEAFPLSWPVGWPRTKTPTSSRFDVSFAAARDGLFDQLRLLGAKLPVLSTNVPLRRDGLPYANQPEPTDRGAAIYFVLSGKSMVFACDRWDRVKDNVRALEKTIEAIRGIERWGASDMLERAFSGFVALAAPGTKKTWREVFGFHDIQMPSAAELNRTWRDLAARRHPDAGGSHDLMAELNAARAEALKEIKG